MNARASPRRQARVAGLLYLLVIAGGAFADAYVRQRLVVPGDAASTAANILGNEALYRIGFVADLVPLLCNVGLAVLFRSIFSVVNKSVTALAVFFTLMGTAIQGGALLFHLAPLLLLKTAPALAAFSGPQLQSLAYFALRLQANGYTIALVFFGCFGVCLGYLLLQSRFLPRFIGALMIAGGACYAINSLLVFVAPSVASILFLLPCLVAEGTLTLWLMIAGLNESAWFAQAAAAGMPARRAGLVRC